MLKNSMPGLSSQAYQDKLVENQMIKPSQSDQRTGIQQQMKFYGDPSLEVKGREIDMFGH